MADTPQERTPSERTDTAAGSGRTATTPGAATHDQTPTGERSPREDMGKTPGDGTLQDATPAGLSSKELRDRAEKVEGSAQPGGG